MIIKLIITIILVIISSIDTGRNIDQYIKTKDWKYLSLGILSFIVGISIACMFGVYSLLIILLENI